MKKDAILGIVRHALTTFGGVLVTKGTVTDGQLETAAGAIVVLVGIVWSVFDKKNR